MKDPLCQFADTFPRLTAQILHRDRRKTRNFREETITDLLMAGLTAFEPLGVRVDFPVDESKTGEDMDWEFVAPHAKDGRRYLRLHIQAKRAIQPKLKRGPSYWFYRELDHEAQKHTGHGSQAERLIREARSRAGCVPLYMFYHTLDALEREDPLRRLPAVEGVNVMFADALGPVLSAHPPVPGNRRWPVGEKKIEKWRPHFMPLSALLCLGSAMTWIEWHLDAADGSDSLMRFLVAGGGGSFAPGAVADQLNERRRNLAGHDGFADVAPVEAAEEIPEATMHAIETWQERPFKAEIPRPRAIFLHGGVAPILAIEERPEDA